MKRVWTWILVGLAVVLFLAGIIIFCRTYKGMHSLEVKMPLKEPVSEQIEEPTESTEITETTESLEEQVNSEEEPSEEPRILISEERIENPYLEWYDKNSDMVAWLLIPDTNIDDPVMWTPEDEQFYLRLNFNKKSDKNGCLILDTDSCLDPITTNQIIHGHNMKSGKMFGTLTNYEDPEYAKEHPYIYLYEKEICRKYEVMAVFRSQVYRKSDTVFKFYKFFQADTPEELEYFTSNVKELAEYDTGVETEFGDRFITLSTCAYHVENGRFVVVGRECEDFLYIEPEP